MGDSKPDDVPRIRQISPVPAPAAVSRSLGDTEGIWRPPLLAVTILGPLASLRESPLNLNMAGGVREATRPLMGQSDSQTQS